MVIFKLSQWLIRISMLCIIIIIYNVYLKANDFLICTNSNSQAKFCGMG